MSERYTRDSECGWQRLQSRKGCNNEEGVEGGVGVGDVQRLGLLLGALAWGCPLILALPTIERDCRSIKSQAHARYAQFSTRDPHGMGRSLSRMKNAVQMKAIKGKVTVKWARAAWWLNVLFPSICTGVSQRVAINGPSKPLAAQIG